MSSNLDNTLGAFQIGAFIAVFLFGIITLQCHFYYSRFPDDRRGFKLLVLLVWLCELTHTMSVCYETYTAAVTHNGRLQYDNMFTGFGIILIVGGGSTTIIQSFFAWRAWKILPHPWRFVGLLCIVMSVARWGGSLFVGVGVTRASSLQLWAERYKIALATILTACSLIDIMITISMLWFLGSRRKNAMQKVARLLDHLTAYTIRTGLITSIVAAAILIMFLASPTLIWVGMYMFMGKLYSNSLLSALNDRTSLREAAGGTEVSGSNANSKGSRNPNSISIHMKTTTEMATDGPSYSFMEDGEEKSSNEGTFIGLPSRFVK